MIFNDGTMHCLLLECGREPMPIMKYVRLDIVSCILYVLVSGKCSHTNHCEHMRNVSNYIFCEDVLTPVVKGTYPWI